MRLATKLSLSYAGLLLLLVVLVVGLAVYQVDRLGQAVRDLPAPASPYEAGQIAEHLAAQGLSARVPAEWLEDTLAHGGWFQVIDARGQEVQRAGSPGPAQTHYTAPELSVLTQNSGPWYYQLSPIRQGDAILGTVVLAAPESEFRPVTIYATPSFTNRFLDYFVTGLGMAMGAAVLICILAGVWYARWVSRPLVRLSRELQAVAAGDLTRRIPVRGRDEIAGLDRAFNVLVERLTEAERERSRVDAARRDLVANLSHDLRTPLTSIQGFAEQLAADGLDPESRQRYAGVIRQRVGELDSLLGDLLELSRLQALPPVPKEPVDLAEAVREKLIALVPELEQAGLELEAEVPDEMAPVPADSRLIGRAQQNLVTNAMRHGSARRLTVKLAAGADEVTLTVADDGQGVPPGEVEHLFERYYRGTSATAQGRGTVSLLG